MTSVGRLVLCAPSHSHLQRVLPCHLNYLKQLEHCSLAEIFLFLFSFSILGVCICKTCNVKRIINKDIVGLGSTISKNLEGILAKLFFVRYTPINDEALLYSLLKMDPLFLSVSPLPYAQTSLYLNPSLYNVWGISLSITCNR